MNKDIWVDPFRSRILAGNFPLTMLLSKKPDRKTHPSTSERITTGIPPETLRSSFHDLRDAGFTVLAYSQERPVARSSFLIDELMEVIRNYPGLAKRGIVFVTHSRGGLIVRKLLEGSGIRCLALITLGTPHAGSSLAGLSGHLAGISRVMYPFFEDAQRGTVRRTVGRVIEFLRSEALDELFPGSDFMCNLDSDVLKDIKVLSFGGTDPRLITLYRWHRDCICYKDMFSIPDILTSVLPDSVVPEEFVQGRGDGLVTSASSVAPHADRHYDFPLNHLKMVFSPEVRALISGFLREII
ncbi:hypothetical protein BMS3Bbin06_00603 [bacterium BMS3Bbin06]|nr:hypothetical protein BMS3Abin08_01843 [bacterium BMS3Abin08]GBE34085.1 hypothetical protein BMS3Bbin06_00603 [bacterium BMS3Bbin06]HDO36233.1 hypothetical protein [Nitrospirota bacterium]HDY72380.1 hypothetical protein [Nitrospirota bacterium]